MEKDVIGYEGLYTIDQLGNVKSLPRKGCKGKLLKHHIEEYVSVVLSKNSKSKKHKVHRLLALHFIPNEDIKKNQINHIDGNKHNNELSNLQWCTNSENQKHAYKTGLSMPRNGSRNGMSKLTEHQVSEIRAIAKSRGRNYNRKELSLRFGVSEASIKDIVTRRRNIWSHV